MSSAKLRPTFVFPTTQSPEATWVCLQHSFQNATNQYQGQFARGHAMIGIHESRRHFWSPWLHLELRQDESGPQVFGRFSPHPSIWTGFMFSYLALLVLIFFSAILGAAQLMLGHWPWAFYMIIGEVVIGVLLWFASQAGQRLAGDEMDELRGEVQQCLADSANARPLASQSR